MITGVRTIFFNTELFVPPIQEMKIKQEHIRKLFFQLQEPGTGNPYQNLDIQANPPTISTRRENGESVCRVGNDRILIQEDKPEINVDEFVGLVDLVLQNLDVPLFLMQRCRIQCVGQPVHCDPLELLAGRVARVQDAIKPFDRPPFEFGVRFRFAPHDPSDQPKVQAETDAIASEEKQPPAAAIPDDPPTPPTGKAHGKSKRSKPHIFKGFMNLRIETYHQDPKLVWLEAASSYHEIYADANRKDMGDNIRETYKFMTEQAIRFLAQYEKPPTEGES